MFCSSNTRFLEENDQQNDVTYQSYKTDNGGENNDVYKPIVIHFEGKIPLHAKGKLVFFP